MTVSVTAEGSTEDYADGTHARESLLDAFAVEAHVPRSAVGLQVLPGSVQLRFFVVTADAADAATLASNLHAMTTDAAMASAALGIHVTAPAKLDTADGVEPDALDAGAATESQMAPDDSAAGFGRDVTMRALAVPLGLVGALFLAGPSSRK